MDILFSVYILLCSNTDAPLSCNYDFRKCVNIESEKESNPNVVFKKCYEGELFYRHFEFESE